MDELTEEQMTKTGEELARALGLKKIKDGSEAGRYRTEWGTKTALGLYRTVKHYFFP